MKVSELRRRIVEEGGSEEQLEYCDDAANTKSAMVALLLGLWRSRRGDRSIAVGSNCGSAGGGGGDGTSPESRTALRAELMALRPSQLRRRVIEAGADAEQLEECFDAPDAMAREIRASKAPFGGIQLVICGDVSQTGLEPAPLAPAEP